MASDGHRAFLVIHRASGTLVGVININHVIHGSLRSAFLGYYAFSGWTGKGFMAEGMSLVLRHAFRRLKLHRLEANIQPNNRASLALAKRCGFVREGYSARYLKVGGRWRDHERWAYVQSVRATR
jgi:ribosomal-protein-alanine N-acetyltransferase